GKVPDRADGGCRRRTPPFVIDIPHPSRCARHLLPPEEGMSTAALIRRRARRWALNGAAGVALLYILTPLIFVTWLAFFRQEIPSFPPEGYSLRWFAAILDQ